jgi:hypothetical protein
MAGSPPLPASSTVIYFFSWKRTKPLGFWGMNLLVNIFSKPRILQGDLLSWALGCRNGRPPVVAESVYEAFEGGRRSENFCATFCAISGAFPPARLLMITFAWMSCWIAETMRSAVSFTI